MRLSPTRVRHRILSRQPVTRRWLKRRTSPARMRGRRGPHTATYGSGEGSVYEPQNPRSPGLAARARTAPGAREASLPTPHLDRLCIPGAVQHSPAGMSLYPEVGE